jgi:predicted enzyme related to lactoylglutathione lyase
VTGIGKLRNLTVDAPDPGALARFYLDLLDAEMRHESPEWTVIRTAEGYLLGFQPAPDHIAPRWPSRDAPQQMHLDLDVPEVATAAARAVARGATRIGGDGDTLVVLADPAGHPFCLFTMAPPAERIRVFGVAIDCPDPKPLSDFYAALLGMEVRQQGDDGAWIADDGPLANVMFQGVRGYRAPRWPDPAAPQQMHLDVKVDDVDTAEAAVLAIGGVALPGRGDDWRVFADPAGHPFCLVFTPG